MSRKWVCQDPAFRNSHRPSRCSCVRKPAVGSELTDLHGQKQPARFPEAGFTGRCPLAAGVFDLAVVDAAGERTFEENGLSLTS